MTRIKLFMAPNTCARVTAIALEELDLEFECEVVRFLKQEQKSSKFKKINPVGRVPALIYDGHALTENVAILFYLNSRHGRLLPYTHDSLEQARQLADLCFCSSILHPLVTRIRMPHLYAGPDAARAIKTQGCSAMDEYFGLVEERLSDRDWWYSEFSIMDAYLYWCFWRVEGAGYDVARFPKFTSLARRTEDRVSVKRAIAREVTVQKSLEDEGLAFTPPLFD